MKAWGWRAFSTLLLAEALLMGVSFIQNGQPLQIYASGSNNLAIRLPSLTALFDYAPPKPPAADTLLKKYLAHKPTKPQKKRISGADTLTSPTFSDTTSLDYKIRIENPTLEGGQALDNFFAALSNLSDTTLLRIAHYGDSQIEGDRITQFLRYDFQARFGGGGLGYVSLSDPATHHSLTRNVTENWLRFTVFQNQQRSHYYDLSGLDFHYTGGQADTLPDDTLAKPVASVAFDILDYTRYKKLRLAWGRGGSGKQIIAYANGKPYWQDTLHNPAPFQLLDIPLPPDPKHIRLGFKGSTPNVYGLLLDPAHGVQVDNYGLRGHSGNFLAKIDPEMMATEIHALGTRLFIFQYGGNIVPYDVKSFQFYEDDVYRMLMRYKAAAPDASFLVMGVGDMAHKVDDAYQSFKTVPQIRDAQRRAARRAGCAFWDMYRVMGGENAIISWVNANPPLAAPDYAHFSYPGQKLIGDLLFKALMNEYTLYLKKMALQQNSSNSIPAK